MFFFSRGRIESGNTQCWWKLQPYRLHCDTIRTSEKSNLLSTKYFCPLYRLVRLPVPKKLGNNAGCKIQCSAGQQTWWAVWSLFGKLQNSELYAFQVIKIWSFWRGNTRGTSSVFLSYSQTNSSYRSAICMILQKRSLSQNHTMTNQCFFRPLSKSGKRKACATWQRRATVFNPTGTLGLSYVHSPQREPVDFKTFYGTLGKTLFEVAWWTVYCHHPVPL